MTQLQTESTSHVMYIDGGKHSLRINLSNLSKCNDFAAKIWKDKAISINIKKRL